MCPLLAQLEIGFFSSFSAAAVYSTNEANKAGLKESIIFRCLWLATISILSILYFYTYDYGWSNGTYKDIYRTIEIGGTTHFCLDQNVKPHAVNSENENVNEQRFTIELIKQSPK